MSILIRKSEDIYRAHGKIENGQFSGRWHFSFDEYRDSHYVSFGTLRVFNDDTLSPGAVWPLHPHRNIEVVTYCAQGEFRHADERGKGGVLKKGWVQHTSVGSGIWHSEINDRKDIPMRFIQMWFIPDQDNLPCLVEQRRVEQEERTNRLLLLVSNTNRKALRIFSDAEVFSSFLQKGNTVKRALRPGKGVYLYVLEGGPVLLNTKTIPEFAAAEIFDEEQVILTANKDSELILVETDISEK